MSSEEILSFWFVKVVLIWPVAEELIFRGVIQGWLMERGLGDGERGRQGDGETWRQGDGEIGGKAAVLSRANLIASVLFAAAHLVYHSGLHAALVFFPSLVFGYFKERYDAIWPPIALHVGYNACWFFVMSNK
ncbi:MAG: JDVT-CTERM system glutamic-type intramembrane protease [Planctomycetota bacterium]|nr:JDVT-CTERM system glutamic-type intramembrane protease [Planctomycetota bacterium]